MLNFNNAAFCSARNYEWLLIGAASLVLLFISLFTWNCVVHYTLALKRKIMEVIFLPYACYCYNS